MLSLFCLGFSLQIQILFWNELKVHYDKLDDINFSALKFLEEKEFSESLNDKLDEYSYCSS